jgi:hypothetical protein
VPESRSVETTIPRHDEIKEFTAKSILEKGLIVGIGTPCNPDDSRFPRVKNKPPG